MSLTPYFDRFRSTSNRDDPPEIVLLHGWGMHSLIWDPIVPGLLEHFQVTVVDLPGLGRSPLPNTDYNLDLLVEQVLLVAPRRAIWMGWSLGGMVALKAAHQQPERVRALVTVATSPKFTAAADWPVALKPEVLQAFYDLLLEDPEGTLIRFLSLQCKGSSTIKEDIRQLRELVYFHGLPARRALQGGLKILQQADLRKELAAVACPVLQIFGSEDHLVPSGVSQQVREYRPGLTTAVIKDVSHVPFLSAADLYLAACYDFFNQEQLL